MRRPSLIPLWHPGPSLASGANERVAGLLVSPGISLDWLSLHLTAHDVDALGPRARPGFCGRGRLGLTLPSAQCEESRHVVGRHSSETRDTDQPEIDGTDNFARSEREARRQEAGSFPHQSRSAPCPSWVILRIVCGNRVNPLITGSQRKYVHVGFQDIALLWRHALQGAKRQPRLPKTRRIGTRPEAAVASQTP